MIDIKGNELINAKLDTLYKNHTQDFLHEWQKAFDEEPPSRINEFGIINIEKYNKDKGVLFICRETNGWDNEDYANGCLFRKWMCDITKEGLAGKGHIQKHPQMWYNIGRWAKLMESPETPFDKIASLKSEAIKNIGTIAFTNVNKVRGKKKSGKEYNKLAKSSVAGEVLRREVEIINPKVVVCCGTGWVFDRHVQNYTGKVVYMPHPAAILSTEEMLSMLKKQI